MLDELPAVVKQVLKLYNMEVNTVVIPKSYAKTKTIRIKTTITFTPKEINIISPETVESYGVFDYRNDSSRLFLDMVYLRDSDMPILSYIDDDYGLDVFLTEIVETETKKKFEEVRHKL